MIIIEVLILIVSTDRLALDVFKILRDYDIV